MARKRQSQRVTSYEVAKLAGVSQATVSRAFTAGAQIAKDKKDRVLAAAKQLNYYPNSIASSLASASTNIIAVIVGNLDNPFYVESLHAFITHLQASGKHVLSFTISQGKACDDAVLEALKYNVDAIIVTSAPLSNDLVSMTKGAGIPILLFNRSSDDPTLLSVRCDNFGGGQELGKVIYDAGARKVLILRGDPQGSTSRDRVAGFRLAVQDKAIEAVRIEEIDGNSSYDGARDAIRERFKGPNPTFPDAIYAVNDIMAIGCIDELRERFDLKFPEDIMIVGFDGIREGQLQPYKLTTIRQPINAMVLKTLELLAAIGDEEDTVKADSCVIPGRFFEGSTVTQMEQVGTKIP
ncbi:transcriptional regulator, LacI family [Sulfitobacter marinus]|uniref:Transcriptional regulator, LacI family n=1 Tax=Sulfitobacter marinus TaxID=394264 RepID=A0A1I6R0A9_9RHOB|nr:LacI family DNA-binding transcriptional regulator [Sulfitobacter marinus]SFS58093.1 transcriptional regulator, LacI family [Sulfitobacter marinus]